MKKILKEDFIYEENQEDGLDKINENFTELEEKYNNIKLVPGPQGEQGIKGEKGEAGLKGEIGPAGRDGTGIGDMLKSENLSGLNDNKLARDNLGVFSKTEINNFLKNKVEKIENFGLSKNSFSDEEKFKLQNLTKDYTKLENLPNLFSGSYNDLRDKPNIQNSGIDENYAYQKIEDVRDVNRLPRDEKYKNTNAHFGFINGHIIGLPGTWYDVVTYNGWDASHNPSHPVKQVAHGIDGLYFRRQNGDNSWSSWQKVTTNDRIAEDLKIDSIREKSDFDNSYDFFILQSFNDKQNYKFTWENLLRNVKQNIQGAGITKLYDSGNLGYGNTYQEYNHNLNIQDWEFFEGRYTFELFFKSGFQLKKMNGIIQGYGDGQIFWSSSYNGNNSISVDSNKIRIQKGDYGDLRRILIYKNY